MRQLPCTLGSSILRLTSGRALSGDVKVDEFSLETEINEHLNDMLKKTLSGFVWLDYPDLGVLDVRASCDLKYFVVVFVVVLFSV